MKAPQRNDVSPAGLAPKEYQDAIRQFGGLNPFGEPNFRLTIAEETKTFQGGEWHEWPNGAKLKNRGGMYVSEDGRTVDAPKDKPIRVVAEMRWIRRYPDLRGWIFQEWFPAHCYGNAEDWYKLTVPGHKDLCRLGPFPVFGDYELCLPFGFGQPADEEVARLDSRFQGRPGLPPLEVLRTSVQYGEKCRDFWQAMPPASRRRCREDQMIERSALQEKWLRDRDMAMNRDAMSPLFSNSLEAGRWRTQLAKDAGLSIGHVGN